MTVSLATALYDATRAAIFSKRNVDKTFRGDVVRGAVAAGQLKNATEAISTFDNMVGKTALSCTNSFNSLAKSGSALGYAAKGVNWASKHINPLICVSGAVKVAMADDKKSEAINQGCALTSMFAVEKATKLLQTTQGRAKLANMSIGQNKLIQKLMKAMNYIDKVAQKSHSKWGRIGIPCLKGIGFVCMSIAGYSMGSYLGEKINEMRKDKTSIKYAA